MFRPLQLELGLHPSYSSISNLWISYLIASFLEMLNGEFSVLTYGWGLICCRLPEEHLGVYRRKRGYSESTYECGLICCCLREDQGRHVEVYR
jgi:hypothetical protein